jgi:hypothetical protein
MFAFVLMQNKFHFLPNPTRPMDPLQELREIQTKQAMLERQLAQGGLDKDERVSINNRLQGLSIEASTWGAKIEAPPQPFLSKEWNTKQFYKIRDETPQVMFAGGAMFMTGKLFGWTPLQNAAMTAVSVVSVIMFR